MAAFYAINFFWFFLLKDGVQTATWSASSLQDGQQLYACAGEMVTLTWQYTMHQGEELGDIHWLHNGQELVAILSHGTFLATPSFNQRVTWVDNAGLTLSNVLMADSGNYSVEVNVYSQGGNFHTLLRQTVTVHVTDGELHVVQDPDPVYNNVIGKWRIQLKCGHFIFQDDAPFNVEWTTPSGQVYNSTSFSHGYFNFHIPMPVETGYYVCIIPAHVGALTCLHGNVNQSRVALRVNSVEARLQLLEKEKWDLKQKQAANQEEVTQVKRQLASTSISDTILTELQSRIRKLEDAGRDQVAFHATHLLTFDPPMDTPLLFDHVIYNKGNAYNASTGYFTAPYSGLYFFIAKTASATVGTNSYYNLMLDNIRIDMAYTIRPRIESVLGPEQSPVHGVVHMAQGHRVWVRSQGLLKWREVSSFTGFLLARDP